ncbi:hypothetical protein PHYBLDRAFT_152542 [Phycomyces blakesleeanus NRRL 1555(-)]|uniref:Reverse transcriptase zinc-binding domain-containing protein n=1 Tax=Phycomyces blakesleeanus (strain ATCC 8743b / DSM 1359 / FGSC 10004 / NBRC 33097 / NRRL 1555) TaxID=763407 RepID=A0A167JQ05_PHYB8|nr:hypothetical protein PHYBLDRAFT_152542 [Phycomyces blakesleeanus NRRL 1555(-)]OAD66467.1 hypothetical protein PHYBLDRAFT_152542 [Phycomyces blakesleeanus NRRL 1555(-)]|eukprot:XP_018284507.1 hypothetical protein PHYBLDRAFT_152542 [Phycomyces blakesleeanus NRRL 1555(-)]
MAYDMPATAFSPSFAICSLWWEILWERVSTAEFVFNRTSSFLPSPNCPLCLSAVDYLQHFVFSRPCKFPVWTLIAIASITVHTIWRARWAVVFDNSPFFPNVVAAKVVTAIHRSHDLNST